MDKKIQELRKKRKKIQESGGKKYKRVLRVEVKNKIKVF